MTIGIRPEHVTDAGSEALTERARAGAAEDMAAALAGGVRTRDTLHIIESVARAGAPVVLITDEDKRTLPLGIMHFMGGHQLDVGMIATGLMIAIAPVILLYALFSETMIKGMTAGAVR